MRNINDNGEFSIKCDSCGKKVYLSVIGHDFTLNRLLSAFSAIREFGWTTGPGKEAFCDECVENGSVKR
jgi:hypothetical protein